MKIISHRGYWIDPKEQNKYAAFSRSFSNGFGTETDLRDLDGEIVISHDMPRTHDKPMTFEGMLEIYVKYAFPGTLALNIKADGLQAKVRNYLDAFNVKDYYLFDMSVPDAMVAAKAGLRLLTRQSDVEKTPVMLDIASGVWMDAFEREWVTRETLVGLLDAGKHCFIVSPELHSRDYLPVWSKYKSWGISDLGMVTLCTDFPEHARNYFLE